MFGYNWTAAIILGAVLWFVADGEWHIVKLPSVLLLCSIVFLAVLVSWNAKKEANEVERLWGENFLKKDFLKKFCVREAKKTKTNWNLFE